MDDESSVFESVAITILAMVLLYAAAVIVENFPL